MTSLLHRRRFLTACGTGALALCGLELAKQEVYATTNFQWGWPNNAFTHAELHILQHAMNVVAANLTEDNIRNQTYARANRSLVDNNYCNVIQLPVRSDWSWHCMGYQLAYYLRAHIPRVHLQTTYQQAAFWAFAPIGAVRTHNITQRTGQLSGEFNITINRYWFSRGQGNDPAAWAGVIAHEMMHNLGHIHGDNEYGTHLQINAIQEQVYLAGRAGRGMPTQRTACMNAFCPHH